MDWLFGEVGELGLWWVERYTFIQKDGGEKRKTESRNRGLPVWEADLRVNLFSCLTSWSPSKTNRATKQSNQTVMLDKYTCPLNGYTPPELSFSFMVTSKVRKITFFVSLVNIIPIPPGDGNVLFQQVRIKWYMSVYWDAISMLLSLHQESLQEVQQMVTARRHSTEPLSANHLSE